MCRILVNKHNLKFDYNEILQSYNQNSDGTGIFYFNKLDNTAHVTKYAKGTPIETIWQDIENINNNINIMNVIIHFRYGTSGGIGEKQTHPIYINNNIYLFHNGVLSDYEGDTTKFSDTECLVFQLDILFKMLNITTLKQLKDNELLTAKISNMVKGNKIVLAQGKEHLIINESLGEGNGEIWRSGKQIEWGETAQYNYDNYINNGYEKQKQNQDKQRLFNISKRTPRTKTKANKRPTRN